MYNIFLDGEVDMAAAPTFPITQEALLNFLYAIYYFMRDIIRFILENTLFKEFPEYAALYGDVITFLISITAIYLVLVMFEAVKKYVKIILILGWGLLILSIALTVLKGA